MPLADVTEIQWVIAASFGADASSIPTSFDFALWVGDIDSGVEFAYPGYTRVTVTNNTTNFVNNGDGSCTVTLSFPAATGASTTDDADRVVCFNGSARVFWEYLDAPVTVDDAGSIDDIAATVYQANATLLP